MQCKGITKKGTRCKIQGPSEYCRFHNPTTTVAAAPTIQPLAPRIDKSGYIYVYTLKAPKEAKVFDRNANEYKRLKQGFWHGLFSTEKVLIKVGYTSRTPLERISQWESQCKHQLVPVIPKRHRYAPHYDTINCGWQSESAFKVEQNILHILRQQFGSGRVECGACGKQTGRPGIHIEWFLLSKKRVKQVFSIIEASIL